jgi:hypothetical protein
MKSGSAALRAVTLVGMVAACGDDTSVGSSGGPDRPAECDRAPQSVQCACENCESDGGTCADGCINSQGQLSTLCYFPSKPGPDSFLCDGLLTCALGEVCFFQNPGGDGCYQHLCISPPPGARTT